MIISINEKKCKIVCIHQNMQLDLISYPVPCE